LPGPAFVKTSGARSLDETHQLVRLRSMATPAVARQAVPDFFSTTRHCRSDHAHPGCTMNTELTVAVISAVVALLSILLSAKAARSTAALQERLHDESELRRKQADKAELLEQVVARYRDPIMSAAFELQSRIYNLIVEGFWGYIANGPPEDQDYAVRSTLFVVAQYFAWVEAIRRGVQFLDLGDLKRNQDLASRLEAIRHGFASDRRFGPAFRVFRVDQRAIGELMLETTTDFADVGSQWQCAGYAAFCSRLDNDHTFASWFARLEKDVRQLSSGIERARPRLVSLQHGLVDLLDFLDESAVRFPPNLRSKIPEGASVLQRAPDQAIT
jgi:hypothetical protein